MTAPDEPRATLREDERAQLRLTCFNAVHNGGPEGVYELVERIIAAHVAEQLAPVVAAACVEAWERGAYVGREYQKQLSVWDRIGPPAAIPPNPYRAARFARTSRVSGGDGGAL